MSGAEPQSEVKMLTSTSPSGFMCVAALKYVRTALRLGAVAGMKSRKSLVRVSDLTPRSWLVHADDCSPRTAARVSVRVRIVRRYH
jgi:hypothetical protein